MHHHYTEEARQARKGNTTYREAMWAIYERRHALSTAQPQSARVVGVGSSFLYRQGVLCIRNNDIVTVSDLRSGKRPLHVNVARRLYSTFRDIRDIEVHEMLYFSDDILAIRIKANSPNGNYDSIAFIGCSDNSHNKTKVIASLRITFEPSRKLFVRHTDKYICFGTHTGQGRDGHKKWTIRCCMYEEVGTAGRRDISLPTYLLEDFHGSDLGSTVAFEIHNGYLYAVSNQSTHEVEEVDWTSFYCCIRIRLSDDKELAQEITRVYRRQHAEGAIHDSWTDLTLQHDERTNNLHIVESRREWLGATSKQARSFYSVHVSGKGVWEPDLPDHSHDGNASTGLLPENDILTTVLESSHRACYMPTPKLYSWTRHPEFPYTGRDSPPPRSFILARTKFRTYNFASAAFMDLVEDGECCPTRHPSTLPCLKLRIGSRRIAPTGLDSHCYEDGNTVARYTLSSGPSNERRLPFEDSTQYRYTPIRMWPPPFESCPCSVRLHSIMNPLNRPTAGMGLGNKSITAVCDERSIVYMVKPSLPYDHLKTPIHATLGTIVLIDFGHSEASKSPEDTNGELRWDRLPNQEERCRNRSC
jgi:hypothetical protein